MRYINRAIKKILKTILKIFSKDKLRALNSIILETIENKNEINIERLSLTNIFNKTTLQENYHNLEILCAYYGGYYKPLTKRESDRFRSLKDIFKNERCFIIGNGPSLNHTDVTLLKNEYTFGVNAIFYLTERNNFKPSFYVCEGRHVLEDNIKTIKKYRCSYRFFPTYFKDVIHEDENTYFFYSDMAYYYNWHPMYCTPRFSKDCSDVIYQGQTVTYINLQLAHFLGFNEVYLIGVDFDYAIPKNVKIKGEMIVSKEDDVNHFHKDYFGKGKIWTQPQLEKQMISLSYANVIYMEDGKKIYNATKGGKLEIFPRVNYESLF